MRLLVTVSFVTARRSKKYTHNQNVLVASVFLAWVIHVEGADRHWDEAGVMER